MSEQKHCRICNANFEVAQEDLDFLNKVSPEFGGKKYDIPAPTLCPICRSRNRLVFRNLRNLNKRKDDATGKEIFTHFDESVPFPVYDTAYWWSDKWDTMQNGRDFDPSRSFFEQFNDLYNISPAPAQNSLNVDDCDYANGMSNCKHCFLSYSLDYCEDCMYVTEMRDCKSTLDCLASLKCELCYECIRCEECYDLKYSIRCNVCRESMFLSDCRNVSNSIGCCNLTSGQYLIFNKQVTKEEYVAKTKELEHLDNLEKFRKEFDDFQKQFPKKFYYGNRCENFSGDDIRNSKNAKNTYYSSDVEDCNYCNYVFKSKNCMDYDLFGDESSWIYNCTATGENCSNDSFCMYCVSGSNDNLYSNWIVGCKNCFGCCGLKHKEYCILNKQYSKEQYELLVPKIIKKMREDGEWGEFFPLEMSPFSFNETVAQEYYPLTREKVSACGLRWKEPKDISVVEGLETIDSATLPKIIDEVDETILTRAIKCKESGRLYQIQKGELGFYQSKKIPLPQLHPEVRHQNRVKKRNPYLLWPRECMCEETDHGHSGKCVNQFETSFAPERPEKVYCEDCYQKSVI